MGFKRFLNINIHREALMQFFVNFGASILPIIFAVLLAKAFFQWNGFESLLDNGELYLYAIGFYIQAMYVLYKLKRGRLTETTDVLYWISLFIFIISAFLSSLLATSLESGARFDGVWLYRTSLVSFFISLFIFYVSSYVDLEQSMVDVRDEEDKGVEDIKRNFNP